MDAAFQMRLYDEALESAPRVADLEKLTILHRRHALFACFIEFDGQQTARAGEIALPHRVARVIGGGG